METIVRMLHNCDGRFMQIIKVTIKAAEDFVQQLPLELKLSNFRNARKDMVRMIISPLKTAETADNTRI